MALLAKSAVWSSQDTKIIQLSQDGTVTGIAPGEFTVLVKTGQKTLLMSGVVYPPDWDVRIQPEVATVRAGDRIKFVEPKLRQRLAKLRQSIAQDSVDEWENQLNRNDPKRSPPAFVL